MKNYSLRSRTKLKSITFTLLLVIIARPNKVQCSASGRFYIFSSSGSSLPPEDVISSHNIDDDHTDFAQLQCALFCDEEEKCVTFNFRAKRKNKHDINCQLSNTTRQRQEKCDEEWKLFRDADTTIESSTNVNDIVSHIGALHPPSCSKLKKTRPSTSSGTYFINPEGLASSPLVQVYCNMTSKNGVGVTVIGHDSESRACVQGYASPGSYKKKINYDTAMEQIVAIMNQSKNCEQFIKYECHDSVLWLTTSSPYAWWVSRQGSQMNYWGGAAVNSGECACGMTNSCAGGNKCNCDKNDQTWREDSGYLKDKNTLPVSELRFGDTTTIDGKNEIIQAGYHTLGKLRCWG